MTDDFQMDAMRAMGWDVGTEIPMASKENLQILKEMEDMAKIKLELLQQGLGYDEKDKIIQQKIKQLETSIKQNQTFNVTVKGDIQKEQHLFQLTVLEKFKIIEDLKKNQKEYEEVKVCTESLKSKILGRKTEVKELTCRMKNAKQALAEWTEAMEEGNKGYELIDKYFKDDQQQAREKNKRREELQAAVDKHRNIVLGLYDNQSTLEKNLERTVTLYKNAHKERREMVNTWKNAVTQMMQRETDIQQGEEDYEAAVIESQRKNQEYRWMDGKLDTIIENNRLVEAAIEELNIGSSDIKAHLQSLSDMINTKQRELENLEKELATLANRVQLQRRENRMKLKEQMDKTKEIETFDEVLKKVNDRYEAIKGKTLNSNQRLQILEEMIDNEQKNLKAIAKESEEINDIMYRTITKSTQLKDEEKRLSVLSSSMISTIHALQHSQVNVAKEVKRQQEIHYSLAFKYFEAEKRLTELKGTKIFNPEEEARNQSHLSQLEKHLVKLQRRIQATDAQNKKLNYCMITITNVYDSDNCELEKSLSKIKEAEMYCKGSAKQLKELQLYNQELIVEFNVLKMDRNNLENEISKWEKGTFDLEQQRLHILRAVKDRMAELKSQEDILLTKRKHLNEELSTLRADLGERKKHIEAMRARFELNSKLLGTNEDGTLVSTTELKARCFEEKQLVAAEMEDIKNKIPVAEKELLALSNTLKQFDLCNDNYRKNIRKVDKEENLTDDIKQLEQEYCEKVDELKKIRCRAINNDRKIERLHKQREDIVKSIELARVSFQENFHLHEKVLDELQEQNLKLHRAEREVKALEKEISERMASQLDWYCIQSNLNLQDLEDRNRRVLNRLSDMTMSYSKGAEIEHLMYNKGICMPHTLKKTQSHISWNSSSSSGVANSKKSIVTGDANVCKSSQNSIKSSTSEISIVSLDFPGK